MVLSVLSSLLLAIAFKVDLILVWIALVVLGDSSLSRLFLSCVC